MGLLSLLVLWMTAWPVAVLLLGIPTPLAVLAWLGGVVAGAALAWRARDPGRRSDPVSRIEARQQAKARFEEDRRRRTQTDRAALLRRRELETEERVEARVRELVERRSRSPREANRPPDEDELAS